MSTPPNGWQDPKTNWQAPDVPLSGDFNRIEGNINAIEQGNRTIDPAQGPTGNVGTLRQFLDWFANCIKAITGKANWWEAPDITLKDIPSLTVANSDKIDDHHVFVQSTTPTAENVGDIWIQT